MVFFFFNGASSYPSNNSIHLIKQNQSGLFETKEKWNIKPSAETKCEIQKHIALAIGEYINESSEMQRKIQSQVKDRDLNSKA